MHLFPRSSWFFKPDIFGPQANQLNNYARMGRPYPGIIGFNFLQTSTRHFQQSP
jgi:hypothetical protein